MEWNCSAARKNPVRTARATRNERGNRIPSPERGMYDGRPVSTCDPGLGNAETKRWSRER